MIRLTNLRHKRGFANEIFALYGIQIANIIIPLLTLPILGRYLGTKDYGLYVIIQSIIVIVSLVVEFGFAFSATRMVAEASTDRTALSSIVAGVNGAKLILSLLLIGAAFIAYLILKNQEGFLGLKVLVIIYIGALSIGWMPFWYFQGQQKLSKLATFDVCVKIFFTTLLFFAMKEKPDIYIALYLMIASNVTTCTYGLIVMRREVAKVPLSFERSTSMLVRGRDMAIYRLLSTSIGSINSILLGTFTNTTIVANYAGAEKLAAGSRFYITPFNQLFLARVSSYGRKNLAQAKREFLFSFWLLIACSIVILAVGWALAPRIIAFFLGDAFTDAITILRILLLFSPLYVLGNTLSTQWMIPLGMDKAYNLIIAFSALSNILLMVLLVPKFGLTGLMSAVGLTELLICISMLIYLSKSKMNPFLRLVNVSSK